MYSSRLRMMERNTPRPSSDSSHWNRIAREYRDFIQKGDPFRTELLHPVVFGWLGNLKGKQILDAGCGEGSFAHALATRGAAVTGVDASSELLRIANDAHRAPTLSFREADLRAPLPFPHGAFDTVVSLMALMDFDPIEGALREFCRVLRPRGNLIIALPHPFFASGTLGKTALQKLFFKPPHYRISRYATAFTRPWQIRGISEATPYYHRPLRAYGEALRGAGFAITHLEEPVFSKEFVRGKSNFMKLSAEVPPLLILKAMRATSH